jgi:hypothetical protein
MSENNRRDFTAIFARAFGLMLALCVLTAGVALVVNDPLMWLMPAGFGALCVFTAGAWLFGLIVWKGAR